MPAHECDEGRELATPEEDDAVHRADTEQTTLSRVVTDVIVERQDIWYIKPTVFAFHRRLRTGSLNNRLGASDV